LQPAHIARADGNGAQSIAIDLHRYCVSRVADQNDLGGELTDARDLAEYPAGVQDGLADENPVLRAFVDQHALAERVQIDVHDVADDESVRESRGAVPKRTQALALGFQGLVALQTELRQAAAPPRAWFCRPARHHAS